MSAPEMRKPYAFLSSPVRGLEELRQAVHDLELPDARTVWVDEINRGRPAGELSFLTIEHLFRIIREADVFLVLLGTQSHGTGIEVGSENAHASYWEAELFYAVLLGKKVQVFEIDGFHPRPKLARLLTMFRRALPPAAWSGPHPGSQVAAAIHRFLLAQIDRPAEQPRRRNRLLELLVDGFFDLRGADGGGGRAEEESLRFLDGSFADGTVSPNEAIISRMLSEVRTVSNEEGRLARLWIAYRELSGAPPDSRGSLDLLPHWNRFFGEWASAGSWYGLHGHPHLAVLPALVEQAKVRERMRRLGSSEWKDANISYPGGALASSRYSIAGRSGSLRKRGFSSAARWRIWTGLSPRRTGIPPGCWPSAAAFAVGWAPSERQSTIMNASCGGVSRTAPPSLQSVKRSRSSALHTSSSSASGRAERCSKTEYECSPVAADGRDS